MTSINLTIHNKAFLLPTVLDGILQNTVGNYELIMVLDGCTDDSFEIATNFCLNNRQHLKSKLLVADNVFETKSNNLAAKVSRGEHIIIVQDDQIIIEYGWNEQLLKPFKQFNDIFAVSGRGAHNFEYNANSKFVDPNFVSDEWSDLMPAKDHICLDNFYKDTFSFHIRDSVYRGPLAINRADLIEMGYFDETFTQDCDDHDLMYRMRAKLGKKVGFYPVGWHSKPEYGGTRTETGQTKTWVKKLQQKNIRTVYERHKHLIQNPIFETRELI